MTAYVAESHQPGSQHIADSYAAAKVLLAALAAAGTADASAINEALARTDLATVSGRVRFDAQHFARLPIVSLQWQRGATVVVWPASAATGKLLFRCREPPARAPVIGFDAVASTLATGVLLGGVIALMALGLSLVLGVLRLVNLAHGELILLGAYGGFFLLTLAGADALLALPLIAIATALIAVPLYRFLLQPLMSRSAEAPMMTTFGISVALKSCFLLFFRADTRSVEHAIPRRR